MLRCAGREASAPLLQEHPLMAQRTQPLEPILFPKLRIYFADFGKRIGSKGWVRWALGGRLWSRLALALGPAPPSIGVLTSLAGFGRPAHD